ncbi:MAG: EAL domain-containing protein [Pseudomonadota bacterium]
MSGPYLIVDNEARGQPDTSYLAVCVTALEGTGRITSLYGSETAGAASREYAARLQELLRDDDQLIPINDNKHCLLIRNLRDRNHAELAGLKLERLFGAAFAYGDDEFTLQVRAGIACGRQDETEAEALFRTAEAAREAARAKGRVYSLADDFDLPSLQRRWQLNDQVDDAIRAHDLKLFYQPKVRAGDHGLAGAEALVRWEHPEGVLAPAQFLPHLEADRMLALTRHVIRQCVRDLAADERMPALSINLEPYMLGDAGLLRLVMDELSLWNVDPARLVVEVTEHGLPGALATVVPELDEMRRLGVRLAIDDFGTGQSSLAQFKKLPLDELKVDRSFVTSLEHDEADRYLTRMMIELGHYFGLTVVAEGVETRAVADTLRSLECDLLQGFYFAPPLPQSEFVRWVAERASN